MRSFRHGFLGVALLPLLILAQLIGSGGWFCANGTRCELPFAATCCCGSVQASSASSECCADRTDEGRASVTGVPCGCYYDARGMDCLPGATRTLETASPLPAATLTATEPPLLAVFSLTTAVPIQPPRFLTSPGHTRAPPAS
jgi:hypothetical protein